MFDRDGIRGLSDAELESDSGRRLQGIERRLAGISSKLIWIAVPLWILVGIAAYHFGPR